MINNIQELDCSKEIKRWLLFLIKDKNDFEILMKVHANNSIWGSTIMEYRKLLRKNGRGTVNNKIICKAYKENNIENLKKLLSEKCLENLSIETIKYFIFFIKKQNLSIEKVLTKIDKRPNRRLLSIILL